MLTGRFCVALLLGGLAVGCADQPSPTDLPDPAFDFTNNTDVQNPMINRFHNRTPFTISDADAGIFALMSSGQWDYGCGPNSPWYTYDWQAIQHDPDNYADARVNLLIKAWEVHIAVFSGNGPQDFPVIGPTVTRAQRCAAIAAAKLADGWGTMTVTDNDYFATGEGGQGTNSAGLIARGKLELTAGGEAHVTVVQRCQWDTEDLATWRCLVNTVQLN